MAGDQLRVTEGKERGKRLTVDAELLIGRAAPEEDGRLGDDPEISRRHAHVSREAGGRLVIEDLGSANGTFVNDERIDAPRALAAGDVVRVGKTVLEVTGSPSVAPRESPPPAEAPAGAAPSPGTEAPQELVVTGGSAVGRRLALGDELVIGRTVSGEGRLSDDLELSRRHARIAREPDGRLTIEDLGSANGTFVNGERVRGPQALAPGDSVRVGSTTLELTDAARAPARSPVPAERPRAPAVSAGDREVLISELSLGSVFAGCRVDEVIGHGDMGVVYRAEELALQRPVALKLILPEYSRDERFRERFRRESRIAAAIDHPNVIPIYDAGEENGVLFITMRLVEGTDLRALIAAEGGLEPLRAARIVRQVAAALDAAHARGMLHRDVKPSNVLLGREDHAYLTDFGLARPAASAGGLTRHGTVIARARYVAPEQLLGQSIDARADIYALGCLLFEALTGEAPSVSWRDDPQAPASLTAPPPSPAELRPDLPREFDEVVRRAMAKDPEERYPSAGDLGQAALAAAGGSRRARPSPVLARGSATPPAGDESAEALAAESQPAEPEPAQARGRDGLRWAIALAGLVIVAVGMVAALHGISTL